MFGACAQETARHLLHRRSAWILYIFISVVQHSVLMLSDPEEIHIFPNLN